MESYRFEEILANALSLVSDEVDKREGSVIYDTLAPTAWMLASYYYVLGWMTMQMFPDTATGEWLDRHADNFGLSREPATYSIRKINTYDSSNQAMAVPIGSRFRVSDLSFVITEEIATGQYKASAEQAGTMGNGLSGEILPVDFIDGLGSAELISSALIPARDTETDEDLRSRIYDRIRLNAFGGNIADYTLWSLSIDGVGAVKVFGAPDLSPGQVKLIIGDEQERTATQTLIDQVADLFGADGSGNGLAPIWHFVTVGTSTNKAINLAATVTISVGASWSLIQPLVEQKFTEYLDSVKFTDGTVYYARAIAAMLNVEGVVDVTAVTLNGAAQNVVLSKTAALYEVPTAGTITLTQGV